MLDELLKRKDVNDFIYELKTNDRYFSKDLKSFENRKMTISNELALYTFYEALFKYQIMFDDVYLFEEYMEQLDRLYKKMYNYDDILVGINKVICKLLLIKMDIKDTNKPESKKEIIKYVYDRYITNGYYVHGFNTSYTKYIEENGFDPENYENYYDRFSKLNKIFSKYNVINIIEKDFSKKSVTFTDDFLMGCYYSVYSPNYFSSFLRNEEYFGNRQKQDGYLIDNYNLTMRRLKRFMSNNSFSKDDEKYILDLVKEEWDLLHREEKKVSLLLVKRNLFKDKYTDIKDYINSSEDIYDIVDSLLSPKKNRVNCKDIIPKEELSIITLEGYYDDQNRLAYEEEYQEELNKQKREQENKEFMNTYGTVSILLITGALLITLGVIITIFMIIRGI
ncbi:MAG: hypothetical protein IKE63_06555 [Bacilli bacterium]|nr:hypothetical protein [Bacilli bacterium]